MINSAQSRMARALLKLSVRDLAKIARVSTDTVVRIERGEDLKERTMDAVRQALESSSVLRVDENYIYVTVPFKDLDAKVSDWKRALEEAGVIFVAEKGEGSGLQLKKAQ